MAYCMGGILIIGGGGRYPPSLYIRIFREQGGTIPFTKCIKKILEKFLGKKEVPPSYKSKCEKKF